MASQSLGKRKSPEDIMEGLFEVLDTNRPMNVSEIANKLGCSWHAAYKYLSLAWRLQRGPKLHFQRVGKSDRTTQWRREYGELPPYAGVIS